MNTQKSKESQPEAQEPWKGEALFGRDEGRIRVTTTNGYGVMAVDFRNVDGRLRPWKVQVWAVDEDWESWSDAVKDKWAHVAVTQRMLATAPLVEAEAAANLPSRRTDAVVTLGPAHISVRAQPLGVVTGELERTPPPELVVPDVRPYPQTFWQDVADTYVHLVLVDGVTNPAVSIADDTGVPVPTVRGWIAKCRQLGLIAKGSQGRLG
jgi:hypothetical protein